MKVRGFGLSALMVAAGSVHASIVPLSPPSAPVTPPAADPVVVLPTPAPAPVPVVEPPVAPPVAPVVPPVELTDNPIAPPFAPAALAFEPAPEAITAASVAPPSPDNLPSPIGIVGLMVAGGVFGVRRLVRRKPTTD